MESKMTENNDEQSFLLNNINGLKNKSDSLPLGIVESYAQEQSNSNQSTKDENQEGGDDGLDNLTREHTLPNTAKEIKRSSKPEDPTKPKP